jgi:outer membrane receptor for ferrienterochelin and colicins
MKRFLVFFLFLNISVAALHSQSRQNAKVACSFQFEGHALDGVALFGQMADSNFIVRHNQDFILHLQKGKRYQFTAVKKGFDSLIFELTVEQDSAIRISLVPSGLELNQAVITGTMRESRKSESPVAIDVYGAKFFRSNPVASIFESMQLIQGVRPQLNCNICNTGDIHINGLEGPYTMILIDGMPAVSGLSSVYGLMGIPMSMVERIEVVKGSASTLYGSEAVGGLINVITKKQDGNKVGAEIMMSNWGDLNLDASLAKSNRRISTLLGLNYFRYLNPIDINRDGFTDMTLQHRISVFNSWSWKRRSNKEFTVAGRYVYEDRWGGDMRWKPEFRGGDSIYGESIYTQRFELFGKYQFQLNTPLSVQFSANTHSQNSVYGQTPFIASQRIGFAQLLWQPRFGQHALLAGLAYRISFFDDNTVVTQKADSQSGIVNRPEIMRLPGLFLQDEWQFNKKHVLLLGARIDHNSTHGWVVSPRLNYKWNLEEMHSTFRLGAGNGYRVAQVFTEDHAALTGARTVVFVEKLKPETSWNINANWVQKLYTKAAPIIVLDLTAFYTHFLNRIIPDYSDPNRIIYSNLKGSATSKGLGLKLDFQLLNGLKINTGITWMDVSYVQDGVRKRQVLTEKFSGVWTLSYALPKLKVRLEYTGNVYSPMLLPLLGPLDSRAPVSPWWSIQNIQCTKGYRNWEFFIGIKNLLNYTPPANSIARPFDPFDKDVTFDANGNAVPTPNNPQALTFDPTYVFAPNQGRRVFLGFRMSF